MNNKGMKDRRYIHSSAMFGGKPFTEEEMEQLSALLVRKAQLEEDLATVAKNILDIENEINNRKA